MHIVKKIHLPIYFSALLPHIMIFFTDFFACDVNLNWKLTPIFFCFLKFKTHDINSWEISCFIYFRCVSLTHFRAIFFSKWVIIQISLLNHSSWLTTCQQWMYLSHLMPSIWAFSKEVRVHGKIVFVERNKG